MMCLHHLEGVLGPIAESFDAKVESIGRELENGLSREKAALLDELDAAHWARAGELTRKAFEVGVEVGMAIGRHLPPDTGSTTGSTAPRS